MHFGPTVLSRWWLTNICKTFDVSRTTDTNCDWPWLAIWVQATISQQNRRPSLIIIMMSFLLLLGTDGNAIQLNNSIIEDHTCNYINSIQNKNELILFGCLDSWRKIHLRKIYTWENNIGITTWRCLVSIFFSHQWGIQPLLSDQTPEHMKEQRPDIHIYYLEDWLPLFPKLHATQRTHCNTLSVQNELCHTHNQKKKEFRQ